MKAALLCNGPSRILFRNQCEYDYVMGCNIPWAKVDASLILDKEVVEYFWCMTHKIDFKLYFSEDAWRITYHMKSRPYFKEFLIELIKNPKPYWSCGHEALKILIKKEYKEIDIYGCDSRFRNTLESHTHQFVNTSNENLDVCVKNWNKNWDYLIETNPEVKINFIEG